MKKSFVFCYFLFYLLSLIVMEIFVSTDILFNYAIFCGIVLIMETVSLLVFYTTYKTINYYHIQYKSLSRNKGVYLILKRVFIISLILFFVMIFLSSFLSNLIVLSNNLSLLIKLSSFSVFFIPVIGVLRGFLYTVKMFDKIKFSYLVTVYFHFITVIIIALIKYFSKLDDYLVSYIFVVAINLFYLLVLVYMIVISIKRIRINDSINLEKRHEKNELILKRVNTYSFPFIAIILLFVMSGDILYGKLLLDMNLDIRDVNSFSAITFFIGPLLNLLLGFLMFFICDLEKITKDNIISKIVKVFSISLPFSVFVSLVYNYYPIYKYFVYLFPLLIIDIIVLMFLYNKNKRKIIVNTIISSFVVKEFLNFVLLHYFKYTELLNYNALITSSIITYLIIFVVLISYIISTYKLDGEFFIKSLFDIITYLVISVVIVLLLKHFIYYNNIFFGVIYITFGMFLYMKVRSYFISKK